MRSRCIFHAFTARGFGLQRLRISWCSRPIRVQLTLALASIVILFVASLAITLSLLAQIGDIGRTVSQELVPKRNA
jgi:hypothetical protein